MMTKNAQRILNLIKEYKNKWGQNPTIGYIAHKFNLTEKEIKNYILELSKFGKIRLNDNGQYKINEKNPPGVIKKIENPLNEKIEILNEDLKNKTEIKPFKDAEDVKKIIKDKFKFNKSIYNKIINIIINIFTSFPVIIGIILSIYFTKLWINCLTNNFWSLILSIFIVLSSIMSYQLFKKTHKKRFYVIWIMIISFSISTGIIGQQSLEMNKKIINYDNEKSETSKKTLLESYNKRINDINIDIESSRNEREPLIKLLNDIKELNNEYYRINNKINEKDNYLSSLKEERKKIEVLKDKLLSENINLKIIEKQDPFEWLESFLNIDSNILRFILYILLAVFADIIPPFFLSEILFIKEN